MPLLSLGGSTLFGVQVRVCVCAGHTHTRFTHLCQEACPSPPVPLSAPACPSHLSLDGDHLLSELERGGEAEAEVVVQARLDKGRQAGSDPEREVGRVGGRWWW